jgi:glycosyltransferase involved in cell wall biosynthesis
VSAPSGLDVLHVVSRQQRRGAETVALELADEMNVHGVHSAIVALGPAASGVAEPQIEILGSSARIDGAKALQLARRLRARIRRDRPAVILAHGGQAALVSVLAALGGPVPVVWQRILELPPAAWAWPRRWLWSFLARRVAAVIAITPFVGEEVRRLGYRGTITLEPNHRRWSRFASIDRTTARRELRTALQIPASVPVVGFVGHMVDQKRPSIAVQVFQALSDTDAHFLMAGDGPLLPLVRQQLASAGLQDRTGVLGHRRDVPELLAGLDVLIVTSSAETMTGTVIEAQMAGCPVVTFTLDGVDAVIVDGVTGTIVPLDDVETMVTAVRHLLSQPGTLDQMSRAARDHAQQFGTERAAKRYAALLQKVAAQ